MCFMCNHHSNEVRLLHGAVIQSEGPAWRLGEGSSGYGVGQARRKPSGMSASLPRDPSLRA